MVERNSFKVQRSPGVALPALRLRKRRALSFCVSLCEKQTLLSHYGLSRQELLSFERQAKRLNGFRWMESLVGLLERRLDNVVFRLGFAPSITAARRLVENGHIQVNRRSETLGSVVLQPGEVIWLTEKAGHCSSPPPLPSYLQFQNPATPDRGVVLSIPNWGHVPFRFYKIPRADYYRKHRV